jgi:ABC-type uncharacterized transport system substrate-binding protein
MVAVTDPVENKIVTSLARPGGNITGFTVSLPELGGKRLEILKEAVPSLSSVAVLWNPPTRYPRSLNGEPPRLRPARCESRCDP